jgi:hypothetical protein
MSTPVLFQIQVTTENYTKPLYSFNIEMNLGNNWDTANLEQKIGQELNNKDNNLNTDNIVSITCNNIKNGANIYSTEDRYRGKIVLTGDAPHVVHVVIRENLDTVPNMPIQNETKPGFFSIFGGRRKSRKSRKSRKIRKSRRR